MEWDAIGHPPFQSNEAMATFRKIINWRLHFKFPEDPIPSGKAKDLIKKLLCDRRLGARGADEIKAHPWFEDIKWDRLCEMHAAYIPEGNGELDTSNFDKFEDSENQKETELQSGEQNKMTYTKDLKFAGYTYKKFEIINNHGLHEIAEITGKKKKVPSVKFLFDITPERGTKSQSLCFPTEGLQGAKCIYQLIFTSQLEECPLLQNTVPRHDIEHCGILEW